MAKDWKPVAQNGGGGRSVVAHRGASSYLPEHTPVAYAVAHAQGADYIEPDVVLTRDGVLLCLHDLWLETTTDVAERFPDRAREDGHFYAADLTLTEAKSLRVWGRRVPEAERGRVRGHSLVTLEELILLVQGMNAKTGRRVGLLIETKAPEWHLREGDPLEAPLLALLAEYGYTSPESGAIIQSFDADHLRRLRSDHGTALPLMWLRDKLPAPEEVGGIAAWADGLNPSRRAVEPTDGEPAPGAAEVLGRVRRAGMRVFVWTFDADEAAQRRFLFGHGVDGVITNNPDAGVRAVTAGGA